MYFILLRVICDSEMLNKENSCHTCGSSFFTHQFQQIMLVSKYANHHVLDVHVAVPH